MSENGSIGYVVVDGRKYPIPDSMKLGEARLLKQIAGIGMTEIDQAMQRGDPDLIAALVLIAIRRTGRRITLAELDEVDITKIEFESEEENGGPPPAAGLDGSSETTPQDSGSPSTELSST